MSWEFFWKVIFGFVLVAFAMMALLTTILGARDIRNLLQDLNKGDDPEKEE